MTNSKILEIAMNQSAVDLSALPADFTKSENVVVISQKNDSARRYLTLPFACQLVSYGNNVVASTSSALAAMIKDYIDRFSPCHCFETPNLHILMEKLRPFGLDICFMAEYWLPDLQVLRPLPCLYETKLLTPKDFSLLYLPEWSNALCEKRRHLDVLAIGAYDGDTLIGLAGCSADCSEMWQVGVDVLPAYRKKGIASALTSALATEIVKRGKVPFYCCAWSNVASARNAVKSGFRPSWVEVTAKPIEFIRKING